MSKKIQIVFLLLILLSSLDSYAHKTSRSFFIAGTILATAYLATFLPNVYESYVLQTMDNEDFFDYVRVFYEQHWIEYCDAITIMQQNISARLRQHELLDYIYTLDSSRFCFVYYMQRLDHMITKGKKNLEILDNRLSLLKPHQAMSSEGTPIISLAAAFKILKKRLEQLINDCEIIKNLMNTSYAYQAQLYAYQLEQYN
jgi:hypothetical protein